MTGHRQHQGPLGRHGTPPPDGPPGGHWSGAAYGGQGSHGGQSSGQLDQGAHGRAQNLPQNRPTTGQQGAESHCNPFFGGPSQHGSVGHVRQGPNEAFDPDYHQWREEQMRALDDEYRAWRQERQKRFGDEFSQWRSSRRGAGANPDSGSSLSGSGMGSSTGAGVNSGRSGGGSNQNNT